MYHPIVKEQVLPGQLEGLKTNPDTIWPHHSCQAEIASAKNFPPEKLYSIRCYFLLPKNSRPNSFKLKQYESAVRNRTSKILHTSSDRFASAPSLYRRVLLLCTLNLLNEHKISPREPWHCDCRINVGPRSVGSTADGKCEDYEKAAWFRNSRSLFFASSTCAKVDERKPRPHEQWRRRRWRRLHGRRRRIQFPYAP